MNIRLVKSGYAYNAIGKYYDLPNNFTIPSTGIEINNDMTENAFKNGGEQTKNLNIKPREINIKGRFKTNSTLNANEQMSALMNFIITNQPLKLYIIGEKTLKYLSDVYCKNTETTIIIYEAYMDHVIKLNVTYPFFILENYIEQTFANVSTTQNISIINQSTYATYPIIEVKALENITNFKLKNSDYYGIVTKISDPYFLTGETIIIDCIAGTVTKTNLPIFQYFQGSFFKLIPQTNNIIYTGSGNVDITISYPIEVIF